MRHFTNITKNIYKLQINKTKETSMPKQIEYYIKQIIESFTCDQKKHINSKGIL